MPCSFSSFDRTLRRSTPAFSATPSLMSALRRFQARGEGGSLVGAARVVLSNPKARKCELMRGIDPTPVCPQVDAATEIITFGDGSACAVWRRGTGGSPVV